MPLSKPLLERLVVAKYMVTQARLVLASSAPFSAGIAVGQLQDAVELFLRVLAEHFHVPLKERFAFDQLVEAVEAGVPSPLTHRIALNQLNKARVNFKYYALEPRRDDAEKLLNDIEGFIPDALSRLLAIDYASLSLSSMLQHQRTEAWLRKSELLIEKGDYQGAIDAAAVAFAVYRHHLAITPERTRLDRFGQIPSGSSLSRIVEATQDELNSIRSQLDLMLTGANLAQYRVFLRFAPGVSFTGAGSVHFGVRQRNAVAPTREHALLCASFVVDTALALKKTHIPGRFSRKRPERFREVVVTSESEIVVYPSDCPEILRTSVIGELLEVAGPEKDGFLPVIQDDELAFISKESVHDTNGAAA